MTLYPVDLLDMLDQSLSYKTPEHVDHPPHCNQYHAYDIWLDKHGDGDYVVNELLNEELTAEHRGYYAD